MSINFLARQSYLFLDKFYYGFANSLTYKYYFSCSSKICQAFLVEKIKYFFVMLLKG